MARIRTVKPEFWESEDIGNCSETARLVALALLNFADDEGYFKASEAWIKSRVFVYRDPAETVPNVLAELVQAGWIRLFKSTDGHEFGVVVNFRKHQVINKPTPSTIKRHDPQSVDSSNVRNATVGLPEDYRSTTVVLPEDYRPEGKGRDQGKEQGKEPEQGGSRARGTARKPPETVSRPRDPAHPDKNISILDWEKACRCAELVEKADSDVPVAEPGGTVRAVAFAYLAEAKLNKPWRDPWITIEATVEGLCKSNDSKLRAILGDLRRYPDGAYPETSKQNGPCRIEQAARLILPELGRGRKNGTGHGRIGTFSGPKVEIPPVAEKSDDSEALNQDDLQDESGFL